MFSYRTLENFLPLSWPFLGSCYILKFGIQFLCVFTCTYFSSKVVTVIITLSNLSLLYIARMNNVFRQTTKLPYSLLIISKHALIYHSKLPIAVKSDHAMSSLEI